MGRNQNVEKVLTPLPPGGYFPELLREVYDAAKAPAKLGYRIATSYGRVFHLCAAGENAVAIGNVVAAEPNETEIASGNVSDISAPTWEVAIDVSVNANQYQGGLLSVVAGSGAGYSYVIGSHTSGDGAGNKAVFQLCEALQADLANSDSQFRLELSPFQNCLQLPQETGVLVPTGVAMGDPDDTQYFWAQTWGRALAKRDDTNNLQQGFGTKRAVNVDGSVEDATEAELGEVGITVTPTGGTGEWGSVRLMLIP